MCYQWVWLICRLPMRPPLPWACKPRNPRPRSPEPYTPPTKHGGRCPACRRRNLTDATPSTDVYNIGVPVPSLLTQVTAYVRVSHREFMTLGLWASVAGLTLGAAHGTACALLALHAHLQPAPWL